ncbi:unnamed protein product [Paramecium primaurelia]|uniref:Uncharacterized protein n=1 Tax=Paramecium primaurelia TaxID=5886 RepID=A0A8S1MMS4_PARPR|nr:unnamed protein product [Paramecium primaurelia]
MAPQLNIIAQLCCNQLIFLVILWIFFYNYAVIMELDNAETRSYENKVCQALIIIIVDAGSMGFKEQANSYSEGMLLCIPITIKHKQYPTCTIRSQPSNFTHCVIWAIYLFSQLFSCEVGIFRLKDLIKISIQQVLQR